MEIEWVLSPQGQLQGSMILEKEKDLKFRILCFQRDGAANSSLLEKETKLVVPILAAGSGSSDLKKMPLEICLYFCFLGHANIRSI